jgi:hypothetical protein
LHFSAFDAKEEHLPLVALLPHVERGDQWELLLVRDDIDLVIVASPRTPATGSDSFHPYVRRVDQLKRLAQGGINMLLSHPGLELLDAYELEVLRREAGGLIEIWFPTCRSPVWDELAQQISNNKQSSTPIAVQWTRCLASRQKAAVWEALARDLVLIEEVVGIPRRVTALSGAPVDQGGAVDWSRLSVQIMISGGPIVRWELAPAGQTKDLEIEFEHADTLQKFVVHSDLTLPDNTVVAEFQQVLRSIGQAIRDTVAREADNRGTKLLKACRSLEALAAIEKSLQRGRTVEIAQSEQSEEHNFKGVMASAGCLLLCVILCAVFVVALVEGLRLPLRQSQIWRLWPIALIVPLAIFLGLQFLQTVIQKQEPR